MKEIKPHITLYLKHLTFPGVRVTGLGLCRIFHSNSSKIPDNHPPLPLPPVPFIVVHLSLPLKRSNSLLHG